MNIASLAALDPSITINVVHITSISMITSMLHYFFMQHRPADHRQSHARKNVLHAGCIN